MGREEWNAAYDYIERKHPEATDEELIELTEELVHERMAAKVDELRDRAKYEGPSWVQHDA